MANSDNIYFEIAPGHWVCTENGDPDSLGIYPRRGFMNLEKSAIRVFAVVEALAQDEVSVSLDASGRLCLTFPEQMDGNQCAPNSIPPLADSVKRAFAMVDTLTGLLSIKDSQRSLLAEVWIEVLDSLTELRFRDTFLEECRSCCGTTVWNSELRLLRAILGEKTRSIEVQWDYGDGERFESLTRAVDDALGTLSARERDVILMRFGMIDRRPRTLEEVAQEFNVSRERIRQIEAKALRKLRHPSRLKRIIGSIEEREFARIMARLDFGSIQ